MKNRFSMSRENIDNELSSPVVWNPGDIVIPVSGKFSSGTPKQQRVYYLNREKIAQTIKPGILKNFQRYRVNTSNVASLQGLKVRIDTVDSEEVVELIVNGQFHVIPEKRSEAVVFAVRKGIDNIPNFTKQTIKAFLTRKGNLAKVFFTVEDNLMEHLSKTFEMKGLKANFSFIPHRKGKIETGSDSYDFRAFYQLQKMNSDHPGVEIRHVLAYRVVDQRKTHFHTNHIAPPTGLSKVKVWAETQIRQLTQTFLMDLTFAEFLQQFDSHSIQEGLTREANKAGLEIKYLVNLPNLKEIEYLQGFFLDTEEMVRKRLKAKSSIPTEKQNIRNSKEQERTSINRFRLTPDDEFSTEEALDSDALWSSIPLYERPQEEIKEQAPTSPTLELGEFGIRLLEFPTKDARVRVRLGITVSGRIEKYEGEVTRFLNQEKGFLELMAEAITQECRKVITKTEPEAIYMQFYELQNEGGSIADRVKQAIQVKLETAFNCRDLDIVVKPLNTDLTIRLSKLKKELKTFKVKDWYNNYPIRFSFRVFGVHKEGWHIFKQNAYESADQELSDIAQRIKSHLKNLLNTHLPVDFEHFRDPRMLEFIQQKFKELLPAIEESFGLTIRLENTELLKGRMVEETIESLDRDRHVRRVIGIENSETRIAVFQRKSKELTDLHRQLSEAHHAEDEAECDRIQKRIKNLEEEINVLVKFDSDTKTLGEGRNSGGYIQSRFYLSEGNPDAHASDSNSID